MTENSDVSEIKEMMITNIVDPPEDCMYSAVDDITYDFNRGLRIRFPKEDDKWHLVVADLNTSSIILDTDISSEFCNVNLLFPVYANLSFSIFRIGESEPIFKHDFSLKNKRVFFQLAGHAIGDNLAWFAYIEDFCIKNECKAVVALHQNYIDLLEKQYEDYITFVPSKLRNSDNLHLVEYFDYASYVLGLQGAICEPDKKYRLGFSHKLLGLQRCIAPFLGLPSDDKKVKFDLSAPRQIKEPYVCIGSHGSGAYKHWVNPAGWYFVVKYLKEKGYRVLCIDRDITLPDPENPITQFSIPPNCEDFTGNLPLQERINLIKDADMFLGISSGLSWIAYSCNVPVVLISGFTHPLNEFYTPYRVINYAVCNSCWNDPDITLDNSDFMWCPRYKGTKQQFECSMAITPKMVINAIDQCMKDHNYNPLGDSNVLENSAS